MFKNLDDKCWIIGWLIFCGGMFCAILLTIRGFNDENYIGIAYLAGGFIASWIMAMPFFVFSQLLERIEVLNRELIKMKSGVTRLSKQIREVIGSEISEEQE